MKIMKMITRTLPASTASRPCHSSVYCARCPQQEHEAIPASATRRRLRHHHHHHHRRQQHYSPPPQAMLVVVVLLPLLFAPSIIAGGQDAAAAPPPPHAAALASPGPGGVGAAASSILEQFSPNCTAVSHIFQSRGIEAAEIPQKPSNEMMLRYCESPTVGTCCTYSMETKMAKQSRTLLEKQSKEQISKMSSSLGSKAQKFNEVFRELLLESKKEFHNMFVRTYGVIYQQNSYVFSDLFNELENYYVRGRVDLIEVMDKFFNLLYQKMFQVLNAQYSFDEKYLRCVGEHMKELKPFGDVPDKLSVQIKRSFVATRTYGQALATAAEVSKKLINVRLNADCTAALTKMQHCGACKGYGEKPCTNYCVNVIKGCLHYFNEFDIEWENFAIWMDKVAERLLGSFNIVMVVEPINIKISEAIMNFQDAGQDITSRVFQGCGRPTLGRSKRSVSPRFTPIAHVGVVALTPHIHLDSRVIKRRATVSAAHTEQLETDILDIDATLDDAIVLRERRAAEPAARDASDEQSGGAPRVNGGGSGGDDTTDDSGAGGVATGGGGGGGATGRRNNQPRRKQQNRKNEDNYYTGRDPILDKIVRDIRQRVKDAKKFWSNLPHQICSKDEISTSSDVDGMCWNGHTIDRYMHSVTTEHGRNPEFPGNPATTRQTSQVATQLYYLKNAISHLRNAYNGQDVDWSDQEEPYYGSGSGSGGGSDDEDDDEGSGLGGGSPFAPSHKPDHTDHPSLGGGGNHGDDNDDEDVVVEPRPGAGAGGFSPGGDGGGGGTIHATTTRPKYAGGDHDTNTLDHGRGGDDDDDDRHGDEDGDGDGDDGLDYKSSGSGGGATTAKPPQMSLRRALLLYLLPLYMAWFGGICVDLL